MNPTRSQLHVNQVLQQFSISYQQDADQFIADKVFPKVNVKKQSDRYLKYNKGDLLRTVAAKRAPATESVGTDYSIDNTPTYYCDVWAAHHDVPWDDYDNADGAIDPDADATELLTSNLLIRRELVFARNFLQPGVWTGNRHDNGAVEDYTPSIKWDAANADPMANIDKLIVSGKAGTGYGFNTLVLSSDVFYALRSSPAMRDIFKYTSNGILDRDKIAQAFGVDKLLVAGAVFNSAQEGQPDNINYIVKNCFLLAYAAPSPGLRKPSAGYILSWTGRRTSGGYDTVIDKIDMPLKKATRIEGEMAFDMRQTGVDLGVFGTNVLNVL